MSDYYYILGLQPGATAAEIKQAYRKLATKFHPDKNDGDGYFAEMFKQIQEAYDTLGDPDKRTAYDAQQNQQAIQQPRQEKTTGNETRSRQSGNSNRSPEILSFSASTKEVRIGEEITLHWVTVGAGKVEIVNIGAVTMAGEKTITVPEFEGDDLVVELRAYKPGTNQFVSKRLYLANAELKIAQREKETAWLRNMLVPRIAGLHPQVLKTGRDPRLATFGQRVLAFIIDMAIVTPIAVITSIGLDQWIAIEPGFMMPLIMLLYGAWFESRVNRATPGKHICYIQVHNPDGTRLSFGKAFIRNLVEFFSGAFFGIGYLMALWDKQNRTLHDLMAGTVVAELGWDKMRRGDWTPEMPEEMNCKGK